MSTAPMKVTPSSAGFASVAAGGSVVVAGGGCVGVGGGCVAGGGWACESRNPKARKRNMKTVRVRTLPHTVCKLMGSRLYQLSKRNPMRQHGTSFDCPADRASRVCGRAFARDAADPRRPRSCRGAAVGAERRRRKIRTDGAGGAPAATHQRPRGPSSTRPLAGRRLIALAEQALDGRRDLGLRLLVELAARGAREPRVHAADAPVAAED